MESGLGGWLAWRREIAGIGMADSPGVARGVVVAGEGGASGEMGGGDIGLRPSCGRPEIGLASGDAAAGGGPPGERRPAGGKTAMGEKAMARSKFIAAEVDFDGIRKGFGALEPPKLALAEVLAELRGEMIEHRDRGVTVEQMADVLKAKGIDVGVRNLKNFIEKGELLGAKARRASEPSAAGAEAGDQARLLS